MSDSKNNATVTDDFTIDDPIATVLVVEDQIVAAQIARRILQEHQCASDIAKTGEEALEKIKTEVYDLVLMDIGLPDIDGIEVTRLMRNHLDPKTTPIIALTAHITPEKAKVCLDAGMQDVISKPLDIPGLKKALGTYVFPMEDGQAEEESRMFESVMEEKLSSVTLDIEEGARLAGGRSDSAKEMMGLLVKELPQDIENMKKAASAKDTKQLYDIVHRVYGALCYCGTPRLRGLFKQLETTLLNEDFSNLDDHIQQIRQEAERVIREIQQLTS